MARNFLFYNIIIAALTLSLHLNASANESCSTFFASDQFLNTLKFNIPENRKVDLLVKRQSQDELDTWSTQGVFVIEKSTAASFAAAMQFERIQQMAPFMNIFEISSDRKKIQCGIKILPGLSFKQNLQIRVNEKKQLINLLFTEGPFAGFQGQIRFIEINETQTAVTLLSSGRVVNTQIPFFITTSVLESLSKAVINRWRTQIESEDE